MYALRPARRLLFSRPLPLPAFRSLHTTARVLAEQPESGENPQLTQTHSTRKSQDPLHGDADIGSRHVKQGSEARHSGEDASVDSDSQPFDAARQGNTGGEAKQSQAQKDFTGGGDARMAGSFKDQVGGQDERHKGKGVEQGSKENATSSGFAKAAGQGVGGAIKSGIEGVRKMHTGKKFSTSARTLADPPQGSAEPKEKDLHGTQNEHLKHKDAKTEDKGKGNASPDPHLPSHNAKPTGTGTGSGTSSFSTSVGRGATKPPGGYAKAIHPQEVNAGYDAPPEALPQNLTSAYQEVDSNAVQPIPENSSPSSELQYSSTASEPPNQALRQAALDGTLPDKNAPPTADIGRLGNKEAWKHRA